MYVVFDQLDAQNYNYNSIYTKKKYFSKPHTTLHMYVHTHTQRLHTYVCTYQLDAQKDISNIYTK